MTEEVNPRKERFKRLAEKRVVRAIKEIRLIGNLANRGHYAYDERDVEKIARTLEAELKAMRRRFDAGGRAREIEFEL
jgi:hypothetical protein